MPADRHQAATDEGDIAHLQQQRHLAHGIGQIDVRLAGDGLLPTAPRDPIAACSHSAATGSKRTGWRGTRISRLSGTAARI